MIAQIERLSHEGRGIAHLDGKTVFISGTLPNEQVKFRYVAKHKRFDEGVVVEVLQASPERVIPRCPHFGICGGCCLQHLALDAQLALKQAMLLEQLHQVSQVYPERISPPLRGPGWGYRRKARLGAKYVLKKSALLIGFREQRSGFLAELTRCEILHPSVGERLLELRALLTSLEAREHIAQVEIAVDAAHSVFIFRNLVPLPESDCEILREYARFNDLCFYLQPAGPASLIPLWPPHVIDLAYTLPTEDLRIGFAPNDFIQINQDINQQMVAQAMAWLAPQTHETVLDLFCGLGNFTLPLAKRAAHVVGIDGDASLLKRAQHNAQHQQLNNVSYHTANLADPQLSQAWLKPDYDHVLLDPPRSGALEIIRALPFTHTHRLLYVSCHPATLARDAGELVHQKGFRLVQVGVMDMFPHTAHVEAMALFEKAVGCAREKVQIPHEAKT